MNQLYSHPNFRSAVRLSCIAAALVIGTCLPAQLVINEVCAANYDLNTDNFGENEDWFEIYNTGGAAIDLDSYWLSDDILDPMKFQIPGTVSVPAGGFTMVYASDRNQIAGTNIHTSFKINQTFQEYAVLSDPAGTIIDVFWMENPNQRNHSMGRSTDGGADWAVFSNPTPGASNGPTSFSSYAATPLMDVASGAHPAAVTVTITNPDAGPGDEIRYTLDGNVPTAASTLYAGPLNIATTTAVTARVFSGDPAKLPSFLEVNTYLIGEGHTLPVISITGPQIETLLSGDQIEPIGNLEYFGEDGLLRDEAVGDFNEHGNDSWAYDQRGFDYIVRDQLGYNDEIHHPVFRTKDRPTFQRLIVKAAANDNYPFDNTAGGGCHVIDAYVHSLSQIGDLRLDERSHEPCLLYVNGQYWGVYDVREKVDDTDFTEYYYNQGPGQVDFIKTWGGTWYEYDSGTAYEWDELVDFILNNDMTDDANYTYVKSVFNTGSLIDYFVLNSYVVTTDWLNWNTGWWRGVNPNGTKKKWRYILWDNDASFGQYVNFTGVPDTSPEADLCNPENIGDPGGQGHVPILNALMENEDFYNDYVSRFVDLSQSVFTCEHMIYHLDSLITMIEPEMPGQVNRWGGTVAQWEDNVQGLRDYINERCAVINGSLLDCYEVEGPYPLTVQVMPPGAGWVEFNSLEIEDFPWEGEYFGGLDVDVRAHGYGVNQFSHWTANNHTFTDQFNDSTDFAFAIGDTITAWFVSETHEVTLDVVPPGAGNIDFVGQNYNLFPVVMDAPELIPLPIETTPNTPFYVFSHWTSENHAFDPDEYGNPTNIQIEQPDTVRAYYTELDNYNLTIIVEPPEAGTVTFDAFTSLTYPYNTGQLLGHEPYAIDATPVQHFSFIEWVSGNPLSDPSDQASNILTLDQNDVLIARFEEDENYTVTLNVEPPLTGTISLNGAEKTTYPYSEKFYEPFLQIGLQAKEGEYFDFVEWSSHRHEFSPSEKDLDVTVGLEANDTITAHFMKEIYGYYIPTAFSPNGDGHNDIFRVHGHAVNAEFYSLEIYDRLGDLMFESTDIDQGWVGPGKEASEYYAPDNVYTYRLKVRSVFDNATEEVFGTFVLIR